MSVFAKLGGFALVTAALAVSACGQNQALLRKVDLLDKQVGDLQQSQGRLNGRIDELQIQISLLTKKLATRPADKRVPSSSPPPAPPPASTSGQETLADAGMVVGTFQGHMREIDPHQVDERLPPRPGPTRHGPGMRLSVDDPGGNDELKVRQAFQQAASLHHRGKHTQAISSLQAFVRAHPEHPYATEALFLIGRSRMALGDNQQAQDDFVVLAQRHPASERAPGALLLAGRCQEQLGRPRTARSTYLQLIQSYPLTGEAAEANRRLKALRVR